MSAHAAPAAAISLKQILDLGSKQRPWAFVPVARQALPQTGDDPELWCLLAENLAQLGLRTLAAEELDALCARRPQARAVPRVMALREAIDRLPDDRVSLDDLVIARVRSAVEALRPRGTDLAAEFERWRAGLAGTEWFRASDGNVVRRRGEDLAHLGDHIGAAAVFGAEYLTKAGESPAPIIIEGIDPPWLLLELARLTPRQESGYQPGIRVVQAEAAEFLDGCALADLSELLSEARVECFVGPGAGEKLALALAADAGTPIAGAVIPLLSLRKPIAPAVIEVVRAEVSRQDAAHRAHLANIHSRDAHRSEDWWRARLESALSGEGPPLRVLIATCRFTTVLGAMGTDLGESLRKLGCEVEIVTEPGEHRRLSPLAYSRSLDTFDPDVILAPNYTRRDLERVISGSAEPPAESRVLPAGVPFVVWVQDAMPHLLTTAAGASIGPLDLAVGYVSLEMVEELGYPREAVVPAPLVASGAKFSAARVDTEMSGRLACDVAMMTHHAETPGAMRARLLGELAFTPEIRKLAEEMLPALDEIARSADRPPGPTAAVRALFGERAALDPESREVLIQNFALRYVDRVMRHETARWCAAICERRGWRFRIYGRGWAAHPELGGFAHGTLGHGDELACAYHGAGITLHVSAMSPLHQRLVECALSGGVPVIRRTHDAERTAYWNALLRVLRDHEPAEITDPGDGFGRVLWFEHLASPATARLSSVMQRFGQRMKDRLAIRDPWTDPRVGPMPPVLPEADAEWLLGDLRDASFATEDELEELIELGGTRPEWRRSLSSGIASRAAAHFTHDALSRRILEALRARARGT